MPSHTKITFLTHEYYPVLCGGTIFADKMAVELDLLGYEVEILTSKIGSDTKGREVNPHFTVRRFFTGRSSTSDAKLSEHLLFAVLGLPQMYFYLLKNRPNLVLSIFAIPSGFLGVLICKVLRIPHVVFVDAADTPGVDSAMKSIVKYLSVILSWVTKSADAVVVLEGLEDLACPYIENNNLHIIPNGTSVPAEIASPGNHTGKVQFLSIGRLVLRKGYDHVIDAFDKVRLKTDDFHLTIIGYGAKDHELMKLLEKHNLQSFITLAGRVEYEQLKWHYLSSDCYLFYGGREGSSLAMIEAVAYGLPVIASDHPGNRAYIKHAESGFLVAHNDPTALSEAILRIINNKSELSVYGQKSREIGEQCSWRNIAIRYDKIFKPLIKNR